MDGQEELAAEGSRLVASGAGSCGTGRTVSRVVATL
jgi:hypothetical protein